MSHVTRPQAMLLDDAVIRLDRAGALWRAARAAPHVPLERRALTQADPALLAPGLRAGTFLFTDDSGALEVRDAATLEVAERWRVRCHSAPWTALVSVASVVLAGDEDAGLYVFWPDVGRRAHIQTHAKRLQALAASPDGTLCAAALEGHGRALRVAMWGLDPLQVHVYGLDRRRLPHQVRDGLFVQATMAWSADGARLALLEHSASCAELGWRGVVSVYDVADARLSWWAALDEDLLGPGAGGESLGALAWNGVMVWVGTGCGELVQLDGRDGALGDVRYMGSGQPITQLFGDAPGAPWALTESGYLGPSGV